jgi:hypothetical protein
MQYYVKGGPVCSVYVVSVLYLMFVEGVMEYRVNTRSLEYFPQLCLLMIVENFLVEDYYLLTEIAPKDEGTLAAIGKTIDSMCCKPSTWNHRRRSCLTLGSRGQTTGPTIANLSPLHVCHHLWCQEQSISHRHSSRHSKCHLLSLL